MPAQISSLSRPQSSLLAQYIAFLTRPDDQSLTLNLKNTVLQIWRLYTLHLLLILPMALGIQFLSNWIPSIGENDVGTALETMSPYQFLFLAVVFAPISEELVFRLPLRFSRVNWGVPLLIVSLGLSAIAANFIPSQMLSFFLAALMLGTGVLFALLLVERLSQKGSHFFARHLRLFVYSSSILFGLIHVTNYPREAWIVGPLLVLPQTTLGFLLAYVRIRLGFRWAVFTHALHNLLVSSPVLLMWMGSPQLKQQLLEPESEVTLLPQDQLLMALLGIWMLVLITCVILTTVKLIREWRGAPQ